MDTTIYLGMSNQSALLRKMDVIAHNVANMNTTAFKKERVVFRQHLLDLGGEDARKFGQISYVLDHGIVRNQEQGQVITTGNQLDIYLDGKGYLAVEGGDGETLYTRNGRMQISNDNFLTLLGGERVLDANGQPIEIPAEATDFTISDNGLLSTNGDAEPVQLGLYRFENEEGLNRRGDSLYETDQAPEVVQPGDGLTVRQNAIEGSNVNPIRTLVEMTEVLRSYQAASRNQERFQELREDSLDRLARVQ